MEVTGIGVDMVPIAQMRRAFSNVKFMENTFSKEEREYCESHKNSVVHFAGTFAAKEAVRKANGLFIELNRVEVRRTKEGKPEIWIDGTREFSLLVSITHTEDAACATAIAQN